MKHPFFGDLRLEAGLLSWEAVVELAGRPVRVDLECEADISPEQLDAAAAFPPALARFDALARAALELDEDEDGVPHYIEHQLDALPAEQLRRIFACGRGAITRELFLDRLVLERVWFVPEDADQIATFDYTIAPGATTYVLAVRFDAAGQFTSIACES